ELQSQLFFDNFELPNNEQWYSVVRNRVHFIILHSCVDIGETSEQYQWLVDDLSSVGDSVWFTAVVFHHPPYSTGAHVEDELGLRAILVPLFEQYGVDIVFNGHDHDYERSCCGDIFYIVTGGGGAPLRDQARDHACSQLFLMEYHFCKLSILPEGIFITVINDIGQVIDQYELPP
ncbi:MAG: metallophosphoesterase, partial [Candidatus Zixiibacteriota bacterium]